MEETDNHLESNSKPWLWKKGQSGNPAGRPKGMTMKEWAKDYLSRMTDDERDVFMEGIPKDTVWKMAEGNPETKTDITTGGKPMIFLSPEVIDKNAINSSTIDNSEGPTPLPSP